MPNEIPIRPWPRLASLYSPPQSHLPSQTAEEMRSIEKESKGIHIELWDSDKANGIRVVTVAGENTGAEMKTNQSQKKRPNMTVVYANSNVLCVNNSMVFNSSCTHRNPELLIRRGGMTETLVWVKKAARDSESARTLQEAGMLYGKKT